MPEKLYETLFALDATKTSADGDAVRHSVHANLEKHGGQIDVARPWDENGKLAYPIKKQKKAYFYIVYYRMDSLKQVELEGDFKLNENIIRHMTMMVEPKWSDAMMEIARNETGGKFALKGMHDDSAPTGEGIISNDPLARGELPVDGPPPGGPGPRGPRGPRGRGPAESEKPE